MKQCPRCNRNYEDDALSFCLEDGTSLVKKRDPDATMINPFPPVPPTIKYVPQDFSSPVTLPSGQGNTEPESRRRSPWAVGLLVLIALAVGLTIGGFVFTRSNANSTSSQTVEPTRGPEASNSSTTMPVAATSSPTPAQAMTPMPASNANDSSADTGFDCVLQNDKSDITVIRVRVNCDTQNCETDPSTIAGEYPNNTPIRVVQGSDVQGARFRWVKVVIGGSGRIVWVASTKYKC